MQLIASALNEYKRLPTREVNVGGLLIGNFNPIRLQTMTTADTMDTIGTVEETIRCIEAGAELVRITAPSKKEAENLQNIKAELKRRGFDIPLVADIHFTPNAAEIAARLIEKVRINPGNYVDKKKFETIDYTDAAYAEEIEKIRTKFIPLLRICKEHGTAMRIGTNHGSLSDRIMSRYGDTAMGMVESAMEFLRIARDENFHNIVLSMKSSNPLVMVEAYRTLVRSMYDEFQEYYPLHLGVTEAGDGEDGRVKSAAGIGALLEDGIGDTVRVSLTEAPELEIPVCRNLVSRYPQAHKSHTQSIPERFDAPEMPSETVSNIGTTQVPVVLADFSNQSNIKAEDLTDIGYLYDPQLDKWKIGDLAADYILLNNLPEFSLPGTLRPILPAQLWQEEKRTDFFPIFSFQDFLKSNEQHPLLNFVQINIAKNNDELLQASFPSNAVLLLHSEAELPMQMLRKLYIDLRARSCKNPIIFGIKSPYQTQDEHLIHFASTAGGLLIDQMGDGLLFQLPESQAQSELKLSGRSYHANESSYQFLNTTAFSILQAARKRITKTEYISCPSCGRTLFDLQETTAMIRKRTDHLKGVKIAIMGCIVNGPGEMADADFGYVGSGVGKITLYKGKEVVKRNVPSEVAVSELIELLKENDVWQEP